MMIVSLRRITSTHPQSLTDYWMQFEVLTLCLFQTQMGFVEVLENFHK